MLVDVSKKTVNVKRVAKRALQNKRVLAELLENLLSKKETIRYNSYKVLLWLSQERPKALYANWDNLSKHLGSDNTYHKLSAIHLLANLTRVDKEQKFERIFDQFYGLLNDKSFITAAYVADVSGKIAKAKPKLQTKITNRLLSIDKTHHDPERIDLVKGAIIESFGEYFDQAKNKKKIVDFARNQLKSKSPKSKKMAKEFLKQFG